MRNGNFSERSVFVSVFFFFYLYLFLAALGLHGCAQTFFRVGLLSGCGE